MGSPTGVNLPFQGPLLADSARGNEHDMIGMNYSDMSMMTDCHGKLGDSFNYVDWMGAQNVLPSGAAGVTQKQKQFRKSSTDTSMPDYMPLENHATLSSNIWNVQNAVSSDFKALKAPTNTPTGRNHMNVEHAGKRNV